MLSSVAACAEHSLLFTVASANNLINVPPFCCCEICHHPQSRGEIPQKRGKLSMWGGDRKTASCVLCISRYCLNVKHYKRAE